VTENGISLTQQSVDANVKEPSHCRNHYHSLRISDGKVGWDSVLWSKV